jgi:hypothetical protein
MRWLTMPCVSACCDILSSLPKASRGTPIPAESRRKTNDSGEATSDRTRGLAFTASMDGSPTRGGWGGAMGSRLGPDVPDPSEFPGLLGFMAITLLRPYHEFPGIHPQPVP